MSDQTTPPSDTFRIIQLHVQNAKKIKAVSITPHSDVITLSGKNDQGKSTLLDCIKWVLEGKNSFPDRPIRDGQSSSKIVCDFDDLIATLSIGAASSSLRVTSKGGADISSPQRLLQQYSNPILLDPIGFVRQSESEAGRRKQAETLRALVGIDFSPLDKAIKQAYDEREQTGRERARAVGLLGNYKFDPTAPEGEVTAASLLSELDKIREHNAENDRVVKAYHDHEATHATHLSSLSKCDAQIAELEKQLQAAKDYRASLLNVIEACVGYVAEYKAKTDALVHQEETSILAKIQSCDEVNTRVRSNRRFKELAAEVEKHKAHYEKLTQNIAGMNAEKERVLKNTKFPLEGLSFNDDGMMLHGLAFKQDTQSQAKLIKAALAIGFAMKPKIPVVLIRDGSLLDEDSMKEVAEMARVNHGQVWIEVVKSDDPNALTIEDGEVKGAELNL